MASALLAYNGKSLGAEPHRGPRAEPPQGSRGKGDEIHSFLFFRCSKEGEIWPIVKDFSIVLKMFQQNKTLPYRYLTQEIRFTI